MKHVAEGKKAINVFTQKLKIIDNPARKTF